MHSIHTELGKVGEAGPRTVTGPCGSYNGHVSHLDTVSREKQKKRDERSYIYVQLPVKPKVKADVT